MSTLNRTLVAWLAVVLLVLGSSGCKKSVEGEQAAWTSNVERINGLMATYPGFRPALEARMGKAKALHDAAEELDGEAKADKLGEANAALMAGYVRDLDKLEATMKDLRTKRVEAAAKAGDESSRLGAKVAAEDAGKALDRVATALEKGAADEASATAVIKTAKADLETAAKAVEAVLKADQAKKDDAAAKDDAKVAADAKAKADAEAKVAAWKCEFCGGENPHDVNPCSHCGAPKPKAANDAKADAKAP